MCGRFQLKISTSLLARIFNAVSTVENFETRGEIFPSNDSPVLINDPQQADSRRLGLMKWGFQFSGSKKLIINARSETIAEKPLFKDSFQQRRCLIPAQAFYEWSGPSGNKIKHQIRVENEEIFALAGLYKKFDFENEDSWRFTIITTEANEEIAEIHNRMPVIITKDDISSWLDPKGEKTELKSLLQPFAGRLSIEPPPAQRLF